MGAKELGGNSLSLCSVVMKTGRQKKEAAADKTNILQDPPMPYKIRKLFLSLLGLTKQSLIANEYC